MLSDIVSDWKFLYNMVISEIDFSLNDYRSGLKVSWYAWSDNCVLHKCPCVNSSITDLPAIGIMQGKVLEENQE